MKKILQVFPTLTRGGLETFVMNVYRCIDKTQYQFDFLVNLNKGDYREEVSAYGGKIYVVPQAVKGWRKYCKALDKFFKEHHNEYIAVHLQASSLSNITTLYYAKKYSVPIRIIHSHSTSVGQKGFIRMFHLLIHHLSKPFVSRVATHYLGCSDKALDWLFKGTTVRQKAIIVKNGIKTEDYKYNPTIRKKIRSEFLIEDNLVIGHVGRLAEVKNHTFLLKIFREILKLKPNSFLMLVGDGPLKDNIQKQAQELGIVDRIIFTGIRPDVNRLLQGIDIIVMPSLYEGLPMCLVEAQASGLPLLLSDTISKQSKLLKNVQFMSLTDTPEKWGEEAIALVNHTERTDTSAIIEENGFDIKKTTAQLVDIYNSAKR